MIGEIGLIASGIELTSWAALYSKAKRDAINKNLTRRTVIKEYPFFDGKIKKLVGASPTKAQKILADRLIIASRFFVNTKIFEYVVMGLIDNKSRLSINRDRLAKKSEALTSRVKGLVN